MRGEKYLVSGGGERERERDPCLKTQTREMSDNTINNLYAG